MSHIFPTIQNKTRQIEITFKDDSKSNTKKQSKYKIQSIFQELGKKPYNDYIKMLDDVEKKLSDETLNFF